MKPFNLERAIAGDPLITRDGQEVFFIAFDPELPRDSRVITMVQDNLMLTYIDGSHSTLSQTRSDIFMAPVKRTLWQNLYRSQGGGYWTGGICDSQELAKKTLERGDPEYVKTFSFEVEE